MRSKIFISIDVRLQEFYAEIITKKHSIEVNRDSP